MIPNFTISRWLCDRLILVLFDLEYIRESIASNTEVEDEYIEYKETGVGVQSKREADEQWDLIYFLHEAGTDSLWDDRILVYQ